MHADQVKLATLDDDVGFLDVHPPGTNGFDLPTFEGNAGLVLFFDEIVVKGFFVGRDAHAAGRSIKIKDSTGYRNAAAAWLWSKKQS